MTKLSRRESEARRLAVLNYWMQNPGATGDEVRAALIAGKLTGVKGPSLSIGTLYALRKQAEEMKRQGHRPVVPVSASAPTGAALETLRRTCREAQTAMLQLSDVQEVHISRDSIRLVRMTPKEETL